MTPWFVMQFLSSPVSMSLHVTGNQRAALLLQIAGLVIRVGAVLLAVALAPQYLAQAYALSGLVFYAVYVATVLRIVGASAGDVRRECERFLPWAIAWIAAGVACVMATKLAIG
jgi:hypothetical protein